MSIEGGFVTWLLAGLGVVAAAIAADRAVVLYRTRENVDRLRADLGRALGLGDLVSARMCVVSSRSIEAHVLAAGMAALPRGAASVEERLASEARMTRLALERGIGALRLVAILAPLVGLLGTVFDLARAFRAGTCGESAVDVSGSFATTAIGLLVAVHAATLLAVFQRQIGARLLRAEALGRYMLSFFKDQRTIRFNGLA